MSGRRGVVRGRHAQCPGVPRARRLRHGRRLSRHRFQPLRRPRRYILGRELDAHQPVPAVRGRPGTRKWKSTASPARPSVTASRSAATGTTHPAGHGRGLAMTQSLTGGTWTAAEAPLPSDAAQGDAANATLHAIACAAPGACVAVGSYTSSNGNSNGLIETLAHGTSTPAKAPLPHGAVDIQRLNGIACTARPLAWPSAVTTPRANLSGSSRPSATGPGPRPRRHRPAARPVRTGRRSGPFRAPLPARA